MEDAYKVINDTLVSLINEIWRLEEKAIITEEFKDMLNDTMNVITHMKSMEIYEVVSYAKSLTKYKNEIYDFLDIIMVWYRDMLILKTTGSLNQLVFKDKYRQLKDQEIYISFEGISHILDEVEKARRRLIANVNFEVAIEMLLVTIKENGKRLY